MTMEVITVRSDRDTVHRLDALASRLDGPRNDLVNQIIMEYLDLPAWQIE